MKESTRRYPLSAILRASMEGALEWRLLTLFTVTVLWTTFVAAFPAWRVLASALDYSPRAKEIASAFDMLAFEDMGTALARSSAPVTGGVATATLLGVFSWPLLAGMAIGATRRPRPRTFTGVLEDGITYYGRMLRVGLVSIVPFALFSVVCTVAYKGARQYSRHAIFESQADTVSRIAIAATLILFVVVHATVEAGRAAYGADETLRSGWAAWLRGVRLFGRDPLRVLGAYLGATLASYVVAAPLLIVRLRMSGPSGGALVVGFLLTQVAVASLGWGRAARLFALTALARSYAPASVIPEGTAEEDPGDAREVPAGSMFRDLGPRKPIARRG